MATKKAARIPRLPTTTQIVEHLTAQDQVLEKLTKKLDDAHVMNGGFDSMMEKVSKIDAIESGLKDVKTCVDTQGKTLDEVHKAIYDKDEGLYQKVKAAITWINNANWVIKGTLGLLGTGALGGLGKLAFDLITGKLLIHYAH
jgi:hypothetical protein